MKKFVKIFLITAVLCAVIVLLVGCTGLPDDPIDDLYTQNIYVGKSGGSYDIGTSATPYDEGFFQTVDTDVVRSSSDLHIQTGANSTLQLDTPVWNDIITSPLNLRPGATPPIFAVFMNGVYGFRFDSSVADELHGSVEIPHDYKEGTELIPHVHWSPTTADTGNIVWGLEYTKAGDGVTFPATATITTTPTAASAVINQLNRLDFKAIPGDGVKIGDVIAFRLYRQNGGTDTFTGNAFLHSFGFHYQIDTIGSRQITIK
jgi:hypothetical protein